MVECWLNKVKSRPISPGQGKEMLGGGSWSRGIGKGRERTFWDGGRLAQSMDWAQKMGGMVLCHYART